MAGVAISICKITHQTRCPRRSVRSWRVLLVIAGRGCGVSATFLVFPRLCLSGIYRQLLPSGHQGSLACEMGTGQTLLFWGP